jgi:alkylation response protein AidB-like acyl-CoA dehydrogenase
MISFGLEDDQQLLVDTVRKFAGTLRERARECEKARAVPDELRAAFSDLGLGLIDVPEADGGLGLGLLQSVLTHEELAHGDPALAVALWAPGSAAAAVLELGDADQRKRLLARFGEGQGAPVLGALAWSESGTSASIEGFATRARRDGEEWVLDGKKSFVIHGGIAALTIVLAQEEAGKGWDGVAAFAIEGVPAGLKQIARRELVGLDAVHVADLELNGVRVPAHNRLAGATGAGAVVRALQRVFARIQIATAARQVGLARASYEHALAYTQDRQAFGKPVAHFQSIAFTLADMHMDVESARWMVWRAARAFDKDAATVLSDAAKATVHANEAAWRVADNGVQLLGGAGFIQDYPEEKWLRETKALALTGLPDELARLLVAGDAIGAPIGSTLPASTPQPVLT